MSAVFFVHGMFSTPSIWNGYAGYFEQLGYRTYTPPLPQHFTHNRAEQLAGLNLDDYLRALTSAYQKLDEPAIVVGHSMGAMLAQKLAEEVAVKALVLLAPTSSTAIPALRASVMGITGNPIRSPFFWQTGLKPSKQAARFSLFNRCSPEQGETFYQQLCFESGRALLDMALVKAANSNSAPLSNTMPVLTLVGDEDRLVSSEQARSISRSYGSKGHFHVMKNHAHWLPREPGWQALARKTHTWLCWQLGQQMPQAITKTTATRNKLRFSLRGLRAPS